MGRNIPQNPLNGQSRRGCRKAGFWYDRRHLRDALHQAFASAPDVDDHGELLAMEAMFALRCYFPYFQVRNKHSKQTLNQRVSVWQQQR